ncbi:LysR substrate-binding domain-containing protein [Pseudomonas sp. 3A(2025)]
MLRTFVAVVQTGSVSAAARQLHLTQGGVSQQVKRLETFFNCLLLARNSSGVQLTEQGAELLPQARRLLQLNDSVCQDMLGTTLPEYVRVGVPYDMAGAHFAPVLKLYAHRHAHAEVTIVAGSSADLIQHLDNGLVDLIITQCPVGEEDQSAERLTEVPLVWIGASGHLVRQRPLPLCFVTPTCRFRSTVFSLLGEANINWRVVFENASVDTTLSTVRSELALTPWLRSLVPEDLHELDAECGLPRLPTFVIELKVAAHARQGTLDMAQVIREHYREDSPSING